MSRRSAHAASETGRRPQRSRRERSEATRARILAAVVGSIDDVGFARTTAQRIARRAGVSVGAVQHHFPAKDDILAAVLAQSFQDLAAQFEDVDIAGLALGDRVDLFVDRAWRHYGSAAFRSTLEILSNARELAGAPASPQPPPIVASAQGATRLWGSLFSNVDLPARRHRDIRQFAFAALTGLAVAQRFQRGGGMATQLALLKTALRGVFEAAKAEHRAEAQGQVGI